MDYLTTQLNALAFNSDAELDRLLATILGASAAADKLLAELARYKRLEAKLEAASDTVDGPEGEPMPNLAMLILSEWERGL